VPKSYRFVGFAGSYSTYTYSSPMRTSYALEFIDG
jgi:hypothetical protein